MFKGAREQASPCRYLHIRLLCEPIEVAISLDIQRKKMLSCRLLPMLCIGLCWARRNGCLRFWVPDLLKENKKGKGKKKAASLAMRIEAHNARINYSFLWTAAGSLVSREYFALNFEPTIQNCVSSLNISHYKIGGPTITNTELLLR